MIQWRCAFWGFQYFANSNFVSIHGNVLEIVVFKCFRSITLKLLDRSSPNLVYLLMIQWRCAFWGFQYFANSNFVSIHGNVLEIVVFKCFRSITLKLLDRSSPNLVYLLMIQWRCAFWGFQYFSNSNFVSIHGNVLEIVVFKCFRSKTLKLLDRSSPNLVYLLMIQWRCAFWGFQYFANSNFVSFHGNVLEIVVFKCFWSITLKLLDRSSPNLVYLLMIQWRCAFWGFQYFANSNFVSIHGNVLEIVVFKCFRSKTLKLLDRSSPNLIYLLMIQWRCAFWGFSIFCKF